MSKLKTSIFLILQQTTSDKTQKGHIFESLKQSIYTLVKDYSTNPNNPYITEKALNLGTAKLIELSSKLHTDDSAPDHKQRTGLKTYASIITRINNLTIFLNNGIKLFEKVEDSCYMSQKLAIKLPGYSSGYTHTYQLTKNGQKFHNLVIDILTNFNKTPKFKDMIGLINISSKELGEYDTFKVPFKRFKEIHNFYYKAFIVGEYTEEIKNKLKSSSLLMKNVLGYRKGYVYINNKPLGKEGQDREYTVYTCLSKELRGFIHPDYMELDIDSSCLSMNLNVYIDIMKQVGSEYIEVKRKKDSKYIPRKFNERDTKIEFPIITSYINNKYEGRMKIMNALGFKNRKEAKQFVTSLNFDSNKGNLQFNLNARRVNIIFTKQLMREINKLQSFIYKNTFKSEKQFNIMGKPVQILRQNIERDIKIHRELNSTTAKKYGRGKKLSGKRMARLYFNLEKDIRGSIRNYLDEKKVEGHLQIHDCVVFSKIYKDKIEKYKLEEFLFLRYGYNLTLSSSEDTDVLKKD